ncbi:MAG: sigma 54-interacting transcriptional regulator [Deltaproteobacteria bacterium]|nr:sigma 54-interacting transcriptional regulator [Deltaproteobacteria bacterium]
MIHHSKILIVDDDPTNIAVLTDILSPEYETFAVKSGAAALKWVSAGDPPDLMLLDVRMPDMDGYEVCRRLRGNPLTRDIPVVFVTAADAAENEAMGLALGAVDYITRPFSPAIVKARVSNHLELSYARKASEDRYRAIFAGTSDGIVIVDSQGRFIEANDAFCSKTGYTRRELLTMSIPDLDHGESAEQRKARLELAEPLGDGLFETEHVRKDGSTFPVEVHTRRIEFDGRSATLAVCRDITRRRQAEEERDRYRLELEKLLARRTRELREKGGAPAEMERDLKRRRGFLNIVGKSKAMQMLYSRLEVLAELSSTVLITGESGTGKDLAAEALHYGGGRSRHPLVRVACSDLAENLIESELFGHVRGAFTDARQDRIGRFQEVGKGTLFLDEIGDIPAQFQQRLLRVLEKRTFERVGDSRPIRMEARIVVATHRNLPEMVRLGLFREDLLYRLKVVDIHLPPLRDRREDIPLLVDHFLSLFGKEFKKELRGVSDAALRRLMTYGWPGNIRELRHILENAGIFCKTGLITEDDLPGELESGVISGRLAGADAAWGMEAIRCALEEAGGNKARAARLLGISRRTIYRRLEKQTSDDDPEKV